MEGEWFTERSYRKKRKKTTNFLARTMVFLVLSCSLFSMSGSYTSLKRWSVLKVTSCRSFLFLALFLGMQEVLWTFRLVYPSRGGLRLRFLDAKCPLGHKGLFSNVSFVSFPSVPPVFCVFLTQLLVTA